MAGIDSLSLVAEAMRQQTLLGFASTAATIANASLVDRCDSETLIKDLSVFGADILSINATSIFNHTSLTETYQGTTLNGTWSGLNFCNATITYTHPGRNDEINVYLVLPFQNWNQRFLGVGGGGWITGEPPDSITPLTQQGYSAATTDGGHSLYSTTALDWVLNSPGNVDLNLFQDFASVALHDLALIGKQVTESFFGEEVKKSYWSGCSTGGRQGLMLAQRYPDAFDGIVALAPAVNWGKFLVAEYWPQHVMNRLRYYPTQCELKAVTAAAVEACDGLDGVEDGIISQPGLCDFDAKKAVGKDFSCDRVKGKISEKAAEVAKAVWKGAVDPTGRYSWYGLTPGTDLSAGLVGTTCSNSSTSLCTGSPFSISEEYIKLLVLKDPTADISNVTDIEFFSLIHKSVQEYTSIIGTDDPDLSPFKSHGGKMITWHGLADQLIFPNGSSNYYERVLGLDSKAADFYRYFEAPGVAHCRGGSGPLPADTLDAMVRWVENGEAPETLTAKSQSGGDMVREVCAWPKQQIYTGGDPNRPESFACA